VYEGRHPQFGSHFHLMKSQKIQNKRNHGLVGTFLVRIQIFKMDSTVLNVCIIFFPLKYFFSLEIVIICLRLIFFFGDFFSIFLSLLKRSCFASVTRITRGIQV